MRNASLDGLRGIAVIAVILYHHGRFNAGWLGVDLFFVLSGYLITRIIWRTRDDAFFWREFWIKRVTRILPPFLVLLIPAAILYHVPAWMAVAYLFSLGDVIAYMRPLVESLRPLWSLAVEEHFYILWPFAVRFMPRRSLMYLLAAIIVAEPIARGIGILWVRQWEFVYFLTPFRLDGLSLGCLLALALDSRRVEALFTRYSALATGATMAIYLALRVLFPHDFVRENPTVLYSAAAYSLVALTACFSIAFVLTHPRSIASRALALKPLAWVGTISYGVYLYHVLLRDLLIAHFGFSIRSAMWVDVPLALLAAWVSFELYEKPIIDWGKRTSHTLRLASQARLAAR